MMLFGWPLPNTKGQLLKRKVNVYLVAISSSKKQKEIIFKGAICQLLYCAASTYFISIWTSKSFAWSNWAYDCLWEVRSRAMITFLLLPLQFLISSPFVSIQISGPGMRVWGYRQSLSPTSPCKEPEGCSGLVVRLRLRRTKFEFTLCNEVYWLT